MRLEVGRIPELKKRELKLSASGTVKVERKGTVYEGHYTVSKGMVHLLSNIGKKTTQVGEGPAELIAQMMLRELVQAREVTIARGP